MKKNNTKIIFGYTTLGLRGQIVIPVKIRKKLKLKKKDTMHVYLDEKNKLIIFKKDY